MQCYVAISKDTNAELAAQKVAQAVKAAWGDETIDLAFLFFSSNFSDEVETLLSAIHQELSAKIFTGCMAQGVIGEHEECEGDTAVILWVARLPGVHLVPLRLVYHDRQGNISIDGWPEELINRSDKPSFILFADPFSIPMEEVFSAIERHCPGSQAIGGIASGGMDEGENRLILNQNVFENGLVGVALWGAVTLRTVVSQGCQPIGDRYVVTKAERNIIYELGGVSALEQLQTTIQSFGDEEGRKAAMGLQIGVVMDEYREQFERGDFLIRGVMGADRASGGVAISDMIQVGQTVQFHVRDTSAASEELNMLLVADQRAYPEQTPKGALLFSCNGRGRRFFPHPHHDVTAVRATSGNIPIAGFFAAGEIGPVVGKNYLHGYTASVAFFCDPSDPTSTG